MAFRNLDGIVVEHDIDGKEQPVEKLYVMDAGDNILKTGSPGRLELFEQLYRERLKTGQLQIVGLTADEAAKQTRP